MNLDDLVFDFPEVFVRVDKVVDGDTLKVSLDDPDVPEAVDPCFTVRLAGIDAPELQDWRDEVSDLAEKSRLALETLLGGVGSRVRFVCREWDADGLHGRKAGEIFAAPGGDSVNLEMVRVGWACADRNQWELPEAVDAEDDARETGRGFWGVRYRDGSLVHDCG